MTSTLNNDTCIDEELEHTFCKKYSRIKMNENVWKRIDFENYKRLTKEERIEQFKEQSFSKKRISKHEKTKCF